MKNFEKVSSEEIEKYNRLVCKVIREKLNREPTMESINVGFEAVARVLGRYDESRGTKFVTFAYICIERQLREYWRNNRSVIDFWKYHVPMSEARHLRCEMDYEGREERRVLNYRLYKEVLRLQDDLQFVMLHSFGLFGREKLSQVDVAKKLGISQAWVSKMRDTAISRVAKNMNSNFSAIKWKNRNVSEAEKEAERVIRRRGLEYKINKSIPSVVDPSTGKPFRFDIQIVNYNSFQILIIEIDDIGHKIISRKNKDIIKDEVCFESRIPLLRIPDSCMKEFDLILDRMLKIVEDSVRPCQELVEFGRELANNIFDDVGMKK